MVVDTDTGQFKEIWPYSVESFAINRENKSIVLRHRNHNTQRSTVPEGIYIVDINGNNRKISDWQLILSKGQGPYQVLGQDYERRIYNIRNDGSIEELKWGDHGIPWVAPNEKLLLFREDQKLALYTNSYQPIKTWALEDGISSITWNPDSLGAFIFTDINMYYLAIPDGELLPLLNDCSLKQCESARFVWLP